MLRAMVAGARSDVERRALHEGTDSTGGFTVPAPVVARFADLFRQATTVVQAGARTVPLDSDSLTMVKLLTDAAAAWRLEEGAVAESDPSFGAITFAPKSLAVLVKASRELLEDSINVDEMLERSLAAAFAKEIDRVALFGSGSDPEPDGISGAADVNSESMGTDGAALTNYDPLLNVAQAILDDNAPAPSVAIMAPRTWKTLAALKDTTNQPLRRPPALDDVRFLTTTAVPIDQTQGTSNDASRIIMGGFDALMLGVRRSLRVEVLRERYADTMHFGFLAHARIDVAWTHAQQFGEVIGIIP